MCLRAGCCSPALRGFLPLGLVSLVPAVGGHTCSGPWDGEARPGQPEAQRSVSTMPVLMSRATDASFVRKAGQEEKSSLSVVASHAGFSAVVILVGAAPKRP